MTGRPTIDGDRLLARLDALATVGATSLGGVTREAYGPLDVEARATVAAWMAEAGLVAEVDAGTNLIGRRPGSDPSRPHLATGSHLDTVVEAGALDGAYGVVAAVEVAATLHESDLGLVHGLTVVAFANEEGARGTDGMVGSRTLVGAVDTAELAATDDDGVPLAERLAAAGGDPAAIDAAAWADGAVAAFVELHVEQGPVLDQHGERLGVVLGITGRLAVDIELAGAANHAGTTPMDLRADALVAAAEVVLAVEALARDGVVRVATCGRIETSPNVRNVVPGRVVVSAELRDDHGAALDRARPELEAAVAAVAERRGIEAAVRWGQRVDPVAADPRVVAVLEGVAARSGEPWRSMWSGAGHDAQILAARVPMAMLFVPSVGGVSHSPAERTDDDDLVAGAQALLDAVLALDRELAGS